jgi:hypothetical protein
MRPTNFRYSDDSNWRSGITIPDDLTFNQWLVREAIRCKEWADYYWHMMDGYNEQTTTQALIDRYTEVCDWLDLLESTPEQLFHDLHEPR